MSNSSNNSNRNSSSRNSSSRNSSSKNSYNSEENFRNRLIERLENEGKIKDNYLTERYRDFAVNGDVELLRTIDLEQLLDYEPGNSSSSSHNSSMRSRASSRFDSYYESPTGVANTPPSPYARGIRKNKKPKHKTHKHKTHKHKTYKHKTYKHKTHKHKK